MRTTIETHIRSCLDRAATFGHPQAQMELAKMLWEERNDGADTKARAFKLMKQAAACGLADAQVLYGEMLLSEDDQSKDALSWFLKSSTQANANAHWRLGRVYLDAQCGVKASEDKARYYFELALQEGHPAAEESLLHLDNIINGKTVEVEEAGKLDFVARDDTFDVSTLNHNELKHQASSGNLEAQFRLARVYLNSSQYAQAQYWYLQGRHTARDKTCVATHSCGFLLF